MKTLTALFLVLQTNSALAQLEFTPNRQIVMTAKTCEELSYNAQSIIDWNRLTSKVDKPVPECFCSSSSKTPSCQMDVREISPYWVKELTNYNNGFETASEYNGPNCFNAVLVLSETLPKITFTHPFEMTAILNSSLCTEKKWSDKLVPGDILVVRDQSDPFLEIHAGIYVNDTLSFSKYGQNSMMPYSYGVDVHKSYGVKNKNCTQQVGLPNPGDECYGQSFVNYFSCKSFYSFISDVIHQPTGLQTDVQQIYVAVSNYDLKISGLAYQGDKITAENSQEYFNLLAEVYSRTEVMSTDKTLTTANRELIKLMHFRVFSLYEQMRIIARAKGFDFPASPLRTPR